MAIAWRGGAGWGGGGGGGGGRNTSLGVYESNKIRSFTEKKKKKKKKTYQIFCFFYAFIQNN